MPWDSRRTLYLVTSLEQTRGRDLLDIVARAVAAAPERIAVQLREKELTARQLLVLARSLASLCRACRVPFLINDRVDVALAAGADGVHLPENGMHPSEARQLMPLPRLIGASCHGSADVTRREGADFVVVGPVYETASKRAYGPPLGLEILAEAVRLSPVPVLAIGGIRATNAAEVASTGCAGVACIGDVLEADNPGAASLRLVEEFDRGSRRPERNGNGGKD
jgi:thiamine-phosphate pyrophosphorylase